MQSNVGRVSILNQFGDHFYSHCQIFTVRTDCEWIDRRLDKRHNQVHMFNVGPDKEVQHLPLVVSLSVYCVTEINMIYHISATVISEI